MMQPAELQQLKEVSARVGRDMTLVQGAGGNTSVKEGDVLWVKASGAWLSEADKRDIFVPVDLPDAVDRFLDHWRPDLAVWTESEFWPGLLAGLRHRRIPALLINARLSERSCRRWQMAPGTARWLLGCFDAIYAQTHDDARRLRRLGAREVREVGNLKLAAPPLPVDEAAVAEWQDRLASRPRWLIASTHPGEEAQVILAHRVLEPHFPHLLTIIVPRHPERGPELATALASPGLRIALRSRGAGGV